MKQKRLFQILAITFIMISGYSQSIADPAFQVKITGKGQPMLFIPGATCSGDEWQATVAHYAKWNFRKTKKQLLQIDEFISDLRQLHDSLNRS
jgi:hypothetical protein